MDDVVDYSAMICSCLASAEARAEDELVSVLQHEEEKRLTASRWRQRDIGRMLRLFAALVIAGLLLACFTSWLFDSYDSAWYPKRSLLQSRETGPPYPGGQLDSVFWFVQVSSALTRRRVRGH